jgi:hypothetical protein
MPTWFTDLYKKFDVRDELSCAVVRAAQSYSDEVVQAWTDAGFTVGEYVVAVVPPNQKGKRPKLLPKVRGLFIVLKTEGNNGSSVTCRNVHDETIEIIHAQDLLPIDLKAFQSTLMWKHYAFIRLCTFL